MAIVDDDIERVRAASPIVDVVQQLVALRRVGRRWTGLCPFHAETHAQLLGERRAGPVLLLRLRGQGRRVPLRPGRRAPRLRRQRWSGWPTAPASPSSTRPGARAATGAAASSWWRRWPPPVEWYHQRLLTAPDARPARDYLRSRGIDGDVARQFRLGWAPDDWDALVQGAGLAPDVLRDAGLGLLQPSRPHAGRLPGPGHVPHLQRGRRPGRVRRSGAARQQGPGEVQELARDVRSTRSRGRSTA